MVDAFGGIPVHTSYHIPQWETERKQFRFPRSKGRRIQRKWAKRERNWRTQPKRPLKPIIYQANGTFMMHPETWELVKRQAQ